MPCVSANVDCPFVRFHEDVETDNDLSTLARRSDGQPLCELGTWSVFLHCPCSLRNFVERFDYSAHDCNFELCLHHHVQSIFPGYHSVRFSTPRHVSSELLHCDSGLVVRAGEVSCTLLSDASDLFILLRLHSKTSFTFRPGLMHCDIGVRSLHTPFAPWYGVRCYPCVRFWQ